MSKASIDNAEQCLLWSISASSLSTIIGFYVLIVLFSFWPFLPFTSIPFLLQVGLILLRGRRYRSSMAALVLGSLLGAVESILALDIVLRTIGSPAAVLALLIGDGAFVATALALLAAGYLASGRGRFTRFES